MISASHLSETLEVEDQDVRESPQAHLHHALLKLFTVGTLPGVVGGKLQTVSEFINETLIQIKQNDVNTKCSYLRSLGLVMRCNETRLLQISCSYKYVFH